MRSTHPPTKEASLRLAAPRNGVGVCGGATARLTPSFMHDARRPCPCLVSPPCILISIDFPAVVYRTRREILILITGIQHADVTRPASNLLSLPLDKKNREVLPITIHTQLHLCRPQTRTSNITHCPERPKRTSPQSTELCMQRGSLTGGMSAGASGRLKQPSRRRANTREIAIIQKFSKVADAEDHGRWGPLHKLLKGSTWCC